MKILITTLTLSEKCGLGRYSLDLIRELARENELIIFTAKEDEKLNVVVRLGFKTQSNNINVKIHYIFPGEGKIFRIMRPWLFLRYLFIILPKARKCDLIHSMMDFPYAFLGLVIGKLTRKPVVSTAHGTYSVVPFLSRRWSGLVGWTYKRLDKIFCVSDFTRREILKHEPKARCVVINNGIDLDKFGLVTSHWSLVTRDDDGDGDEGTKDANEKMILSVGMIKYRKGYHVSISAIAKVRDRYPDLKYYIVGRQEDESYFKKLQGLVRQYDLEETVVFLENISDDELKNLYQRTDLFLLTPVYLKGNFEGFGLVYLEAGIYGKPVVGSLGSGSEDAVVHNKTGLLVEQNDVEATAGAILKILDEPELGRKLGENGKDFAKEHSWVKKAKQYEEIYKNLI